MPTDKLGKYVAALPQFEAERALSHVQETAAAYGSMQEQDQRNYLNQLRVTATAGKQRNVRKPTRASLEAVGVIVEDV